MPAIALVGAAVSAYAGATAVIAAGGFAAMSAGAAIVAGAAIAGGAMTVVGTVTGNKKLASIGSLVSLGAGVGSMFTGAEAAGAVAGDMVIPNEAASAANASAFNDTLNATAMNVPDASSVASMGAEFNNSLGSNGIINDMSAPMPDFDAPDGLLASRPDPWTDAAAPPRPDGAEVSSPASGTGLPKLKTATNSVTGETGVKPPSDKPATEGFMAKAEAARQWIKGNAELTKLGGGVINGAMKSYSDQSAAIEANNVANANRQRYIDNYNNSIIGQRAYK